MSSNDGYARDGHAIRRKAEIERTMAQAGKIAPENFEYFVNNDDQLAQDYPGETVAIMDGGDKVVSLDDIDLEGSEADDWTEFLEQEHGTHPSEGPLIEYIPDPDKPLIHG